MADPLGAVVLYRSAIDNFGRVKLFKQQVFPDPDAAAAAAVRMSGALDPSFFHIQICDLVPSDTGEAALAHLASLRQQLRQNHNAEGGVE